ncbi:hypothetical protein [Nitrosomonas ureae]|uniref:hypothetical protein n=1 Tax=Nitrosomonas ureae TaxID=44577 RepID=UPI0011AB7C89|nr:hypothetical protein [Nitrosomonas ureae]
MNDFEHGHLAKEAKSEILKGVHQAAKSKSASACHKSKSIPTITNVVHIVTKWGDEYEMKKGEMKF